MMNKNWWRLVPLFVVIVIFISGCTQQKSEQQEDMVMEHFPEQKKETGLDKEHGEPDLSSDKGTGDREHQGQIERSSVLESSKRHLQENGIDCTFENTHTTSNSLAVDPQNPNILYVGIEGKGVYKSVDKGASWKKIINGLVAYPDSSNKQERCFPDISSIYIDQANTQRLLLITSDITTAYVDWPYGETGGIWESSDGGESWHQIIQGDINVAGSGSLAIDPKNPKVMYYPVNPDPPTFLEAPIKTSLNKKGSVYKTVDGGKTWEELEMPMLPGLQATKIFIDPQDSNHFFLFTQSHDHIYHKDSITEVFLHPQHGVLESMDGGQSWTALGERLPAPYRALFDGDVSRNNFQHLIVTPFLFGPEFPPDTTEQKSFYSLDGGKSFQATSLYIWVGRYDPHDQEGNHLLGYSPWYGGGDIVESLDAGATWKPLSDPPEVDNVKVQVTNFVWHPRDPATAYMSGTEGYVWKTSDGGKSWEMILNLDKLPE